MANRYWVGGTGNWSDSTNHWAATSGGSPSVGNLPFVSDNVFIDSSSGFGSGGTITLVGACECNDFTSSSGHTYTMDEAGGGLSVYGSLTLESGMTISVANSLAFEATSSGKTITTAGVVLGFDEVNFNGIGGGWTLQDSMVITGGFYQENGTFDANNFDVTSLSFFFYAGAGFTPTAVMGSGTWQYSDYFITTDNDSEVVTITPETSTLKLVNSGTGFYYIQCDIGETTMAIKTFNNVYIDCPNASSVYIYGELTINNLTVIKPCRLFLPPDITTSVTTLTATGSAVDTIGINSGAWLGTPGTTSDASGVELVTNGSFTGSATGWTLTGQWSYNSDNVIYSPPGSYADDLSQSISFSANKLYRITLTVGGTVGTVYAGIGRTVGGSTQEQISAGSGATSVYIWTYDIESTYDRVVISTDGDFDGTVDSVSVQEMIPHQHTLSKSSGTVVCDYLDLSHSNATGGATWYAGSHSTDTIDNDGWIFTDEPASTNHSFSLMGVGS